MSVLLNGNFYPPLISQIGSVIGTTASNSVGVHASTASGDIVLAAAGKADGVAHSWTTGGTPNIISDSGGTTGGGATIAHAAAHTTANGNGFTFSLADAATANRPMTNTFRGTRYGVFDFSGISYGSGTSLTIPALSAGAAFAYPWAWVIAHFCRDIDTGTVSVAPTLLTNLAGHGATSGFMRGWYWAPLSSFNGDTLTFSNAGGQWASCVWAIA